MKSGQKAIFISMSLLIVAILSVIVVAANSFLSPTACNGKWNNCNYAFSDNSNRATAAATNTANKTGGWNSYGFSIPNSAQINNVKLRADFYASNYRGHINIRVSNDGGLTFGPSHIVGGNTAEKTYIIDVTNDFSWTPAMLNNSNFKVNATCFKNTTGKNPVCHLDWLPVNVTYTPDSLPSASAFGSPTSGYVPLQVDFYGYVVGGDAPLTYLWDFKDGTNSTVEDPGLHTFYSTGNYNVTFTVTDYDGDESTSAVLVTVGDFSVSANPSSDSVAQARAASTTVTVNLLSGNSQQVNLSYYDCPTGATCSFNTSSGNPTYSSTFTVSTSSSTPAGSYNINVTGTSAGGKARSTIYALNVTDSQPIASPSANPSSGVAPLTVNFTGSVSGGDAPLTYFWDFKDGTNSTQQNPQKTFNNAGTYNVSFKVTDYDDDQSTGYVLVTVNQPFDFSVSANPSSGTVAKGNQSSTTTTVTLLSGTTQNVTLSYGGCPTNSTCWFNPDSGNPTYNSTFYVSTTLGTPTRLYNINITGTGGSLTRQSTYTLNVTA